MTIESSLRGRSSRSPRRSSGPLRLTRRGRVVVLLALLFLVLAAFALGRATTATAGAAHRGPRPTVVVQPGDTLWQIARRVAPASDPRAVVDRLVELNDLGSRPLRAGQELQLP